VLDLYEELSVIVDTLESRGLPYALCGGIAMSVHGFTRATEDIDLFIPPEHVGAVEDAVASLGYLIKAQPMRFNDGAMQIRRVSKIDGTDGDVMTLDLLLVTPATEEAWTTRQNLLWRERRITVVSRDGLIALKRFRSSKQDLLDIEHLEGE
jgi:hypothetical protein